MKKQDNYVFNIICLYSGVIESVYTIKSINLLKDKFFDLIRQMNPMISKLELQDSWRNYYYDTMNKQEIVIKEGVLIE